MKYDKIILNIWIKEKPAWIPNIFWTGPFWRKKSIFWQFSPFRAIITLSPLLLPPDQRLDKFSNNTNYAKHFNNKHLTVDKKKSNHGRQPYCIPYNVIINIVVLSEDSIDNNTDNNNTINDHDRDFERRVFLERAGQDKKGEQKDRKALVFINNKDTMGIIKV